MKLQIVADRRFEDVQKNFTEVYLFLKIKFYKEQYAE